MRRHTYCTRWVRDGRYGSDWTHAHRSDDGEIADYFAGSCAGLLRENGSSATRCAGLDGTAG
jgi:hypothetical protein